MTKQTHHHQQYGRCEDLKTKQKQKKDETVKQSNPFEWGVGGWWWWDPNLLCKKGQKSRQGRRPSTRAEEAERAAIESPFHRCHRRSPAISLSPSTHGPPHQKFSWFFCFLFLSSFVIPLRRRFPVLTWRFVDFFNRPKLQQQQIPPSFHTHSLIHRRVDTRTQNNTHTHRLTSWLNDQLQLGPNKKKQVALGREGAPQHRERERERERESHILSRRSGALKWTLSDADEGRLYPTMLTFLSLLPTHVGERVSVLVEWKKSEKITTKKRKEEKKKKSRPR